MGTAAVSLVLHALLLAAPNGAPRDNVARRETILWFGPTGAEAGGVDGAALLDAVAVYTRDLQLGVVTVLGVPAPALPDAAARADAAVRARGARLGFWCEAAAPDAAAAGVAVTLTIIDASGHIEERPVEGKRADRPEVYRAVALKLRAALVSTAGAAAEAPAPPVPALKPASIPEARAVAAPAVGPAPEIARSGRTFATLAYRLSGSRGGGGLRHAAAGEVGRAVGRATEIAAGAELGTRIEGAAEVGTVSVLELPVWAAARLVRRGPRLSAGGGLFAGAHLSWASATAAADGRRDSSFTVAGAVGAEVLTRLAVSRGASAELRLFGEIAVPGTRYFVRDVAVLERGARIGAAAGVVFPAP